MIDIAKTSIVDWLVFTFCLCMLINAYKTDSHLQITIWPIVNWFWFGQIRKNKLRKEIE